MIFDHLGLPWIVLTLLSQAFVACRLAQVPEISQGAQLVWILLVILLGTFGLLAFLLVNRNATSRVKASTSDTIDLAFAPTIGVR